MPGDLCIHQIVIMFSIFAVLSIGMILCSKKIMQWQLNKMENEFHTFGAEEIDWQEEKWVR